MRIADAFVSSPFPQMRDVIRLAGVQVLGLEVATAWGS
jgi:hypothetical protein